MNVHTILHEINTVATLGELNAHEESNSGIVPKWSKPTKQTQVIGTFIRLLH